MKIGANHGDVLKADRFCWLFIVLRQGLTGH
jgi:hypothetical protein